MIYLTTTKRLLAILLFLVFQHTTGYSQSRQISELNSLIHTANDFYDQYQYDSAIIYYNLAQELAEKTENKPKISQIQTLKGRYYRHHGKNDQAFKLYRSARKTAKTLKNDTLCALADLGLGNVYKDRGALDSAGYYYNHALADYEKVNDSLGMSLAMIHLSMFYQKKVDYEKSLFYALESYRLYKKYNPNHEYFIWSLMNLGNIYVALQEYDTAFACYDQCYRLSDQANNENLASRSAINKAIIYYYRKDYEKAKDEYLKATPFNKKTNDYKQLALLYRNAAIMCLNLGNLDEAEKLIHLSLDNARLVDSKEMKGLVFMSLGAIYKRKKEYSKAEDYYLKSIDIAEEIGLLADLKAGYDNIALLYELTGDYRKGYDYLMKRTEIADSINNQDKIKAREEYKAKYELLQLQDKNRIAALEKKKATFQRNVSILIGLLAVILLTIVLTFFRMKAKKNRIIQEQKIQQLEDEKKLMAAQSILIGQEKERERIARELHDGIGVLLSTASIHFSSVEEKADKATGEMLKKANKLLKEAGKEVRQISHNMMPGVLSKFGLREAIEDLFEEVEDTGDMHVVLNIALGKERIAENVEIMIYRIIQEILNNTLKHARASSVSMLLSKKDNTLIMEYQDNGIGFDEKQLPKNKNLGLLGIRTRVEFLGGSVEMKSEPGKGVRYRIVIPVKAADA